MLQDLLKRPLRNLRLSVTDRCNLRCNYCMPEADYVWLPREDLLHFEEISTLVDIFVELGVDRLRLTGGEPLLRRNLPALVSMLSAKPAAILSAGSSGAAIAARPGYPTVIVPFALVPNQPAIEFPSTFAARPQPFGVSFTGLAFSEPTLLRLAYGF